MSIKYNMPENNKLKEISIKYCSYYHLKILNYINNIIHENTTKICKEPYLGDPDYHVGYKISYRAEPSIPSKINGYIGHDDGTISNTDF